MSRKTIIDLELERLKEWEKYFKNVINYLKKIKLIVKKYDPNVRVILFGSYVSGELRPDSDIDVLIITNLGKDVNQRIKLRVEIAKKIGYFTPFEIHIVSNNEYINWYKKFIRKYIEIT